MGRRSLHTSDQLRELIISSTLDIIEKDGLSAISAREIARKVEYSPGTLYNLFDSLDDLVLHVGARALELLDNELADAPALGPPEARLKALARGCVRFNRNRPHIWSLISHNTSTRSAAVPSWYADRLDRVTQRFESALTSLFAGNSSDPTALRQEGRVLWAGVQGVTTLWSAAHPLNAPIATTEDIVDNFVCTYLAGLECRRVAKT